jgi:hypothetical protein
VLYLIYTRYYPDRSTADIFKYFDDGVILWKTAGERPDLFVELMLGIYDDSPETLNALSETRNWDAQFESGFNHSTRTMIRLHALLHLFSFGVIHVHAIIMSFLVLIGSVQLWKWLKTKVPNKDVTLQVLLFMFPSVLLWTSGALKESLVFVGFGIIANGFMRWERKQWWAFLLMGFGWTLIFLSKNYLAFAMLFAIGGFILYTLRWIKPAMLAYATVLTMGILSVYMAGLVSPNYILPEIIHMRQGDFKNVAYGGVYLENDTMVVYIPDDQRDLHEIGQYAATLSQDVSYTYFLRDKSRRDTLSALGSGEMLPKIYDNVRSGSLIQPPHLGEGWWGLLASVPKAFVSTAMAPMQRKPDSVLTLLSSAETLFMFGFLLFGLYHAVRYKPFINFEIITFALVFTGVLFVLIGWITPVAGALVRYKMPVLPFVGAAIATCLANDIFASLFALWTKRKKQP